ncbi:FAD-dependent oxidoreductase [Nocardia sp. NBC_01730]|uniref:FAD-dependent oxidoreductase n=1 Tax=Nocardia sp. NBC_01730 TaxID=2975998 RepID=UPI002E0EF2F4|nr:FAD-dependent oxidoreductase [Nocardia sp. NBC_01730]
MTTPLPPNHFPEMHATNFDWVRNVLGWKVSTLDTIHSESVSRTEGQMGEVFRLRLGENSLIYKTSPAGNGDWQKLTRDTGLLDREIASYQALAAHGPIARTIAPRCYRTIRHPDGTAAIALEDLGDGVSATEMADGLNYRQAHAAVTTLATLHSLSATTGRPKSPHQWLLTATSPALIDAIELGLHDLPEALTGLGIDRSPTSVQRLDRPRLRNLLGQANRSSVNALCHGDVWPGNIIFAATSDPQHPATARLIDWQFAMWGNPLTDVALLLKTSLAPAARRAWQEQLLRHYHHILTIRSNLTYPWSACLEDYQRAEPFAAIVALASATAYIGKMTPADRACFTDRIAIALDDADTATQTKAGHRGPHTQVAIDIPRTVEIAVIGAGMFGSAAAKYLSTEGADVLVIGPGEPDDRRGDQHSFAAHYDQARICRRMGWDPVWAELDARSLERYRSIESASGVEFFTDCGSLVLLAGSIGHRTTAMAAQCRDEGIAVERIDAATLTAQFPTLGLPALDGGVEGLLERTHAGYLNPRRLVSAQFALAQAEGARCLRASVRQVVEHQGRWLLTLDGPRGQFEVSAEKVLVAAGTFTNHNGVLPDGHRLAMRAYAEPNLLFEVGEAQREELGALPPIVTVDPADTGNANQSIYLVPPVLYPDGRCWMRIGPGMQPCVQPLDGVEEMIAWYRRQVITPTQATLLTTVMQTMVPSLASTSVRHATCIIEKTPTRYPYIGHVDDETFTVAVGGNGHGARGSDEIGRLAANLVLGKPWDSPLPQDTFAPVAGHDTEDTTMCLKPPFGLC